MDPYAAFKSGGLSVQQGGSPPLQQGPGMGYYGAQDLFQAPSVLGAATGGGSFPSGQSSPSSQTQAPVPSQPSYEDKQRNSINAGWDAYTNQLNDMLNNGLPGQRAGQEQMAQGNYQKALGQADAQKQSSTSQVNQQQAGSLKDLGNNVKNLFQSGNIYLGARGASDSSAANQYSYAISQMGTKGRSDILNQANTRMQQIGDIYNSEKNTLDSQLSSSMGQIADWFNNAQNTIRSQIGQAGLGKQQDIQALSTNVYNQALQAMNNVNAQIANQRSTLETWAANNSKDIQSLRQNMQSVDQMPAFQGLNGNVSINGGAPGGAPVGFGATSGQNKDIFGNIIR